MNVKACLNTGIVSKNLSHRSTKPQAWNFYQSLMSHRLLLQTREFQKSKWQIHTTLSVSPLLNPGWILTNDFSGLSSMINTDATKRHHDHREANESVMGLDPGTCYRLDEVLLWLMSIWFFRIIQSFYKNTSFQLVRGSWDTYIFSPVPTLLSGGILQRKKLSTKFYETWVFITKQTIKQSFSPLCKLNETQFSELLADMTAHCRKVFPRQL